MTVAATLIVEYAQDLDIVNALLDDANNLYGLRCAKISYRVYANVFDCTFKDLQHLLLFTIAFPEVHVASEAVTPWLFQ